MKCATIIQQHRGFKPAVAAAEIILNLQQNYSCYITLREAITRTEAVIPYSQKHCCRV